MLGELQMELERTTMARSGLDDATGANKSSDESAQRILRERAAALARLPTDSEQESSLELVVFSIADERYAIELSRVREVMLPQPVIPAPQTPRWIAGVMSYRGRVLAVVDLRHFAGEGDPREEAEAQRRRVVVVEAPGMLFGLLIDTLEGVIRADPTPVRARADNGPETRPSFVSGMAPGMVGVLDVAALAHHPGFQVNG